MSKSGLIILPSADQRRPEHGAGLDRDGPPRDSTIELKCEGLDHPADVPRRFDSPANSPSIPICHLCRKHNWERHKAAKAGLAPNTLRGTGTTRGAKPVSKLIVVPNRWL